MKIAVITGASSGLGREFVRKIAGQKKKEDIDEIWAVARRRECLEQLREESALPVRVFPLDLTKEESLNELRQELRKHKPDVRLVTGRSAGKTA